MPSSAAVPSDAARRERRALLALLAVAAAVRLACWLVLRGEPVFRVPHLDAAAYDEWARALAHGDFGVGRPYWMAPLYPHLLALVYLVCGTGITAPQLLQLGLNLLTVWLVWRLARRAADGPTALLAAALFAFYGPPVLYANLLLLETVLTALVVTAALLALRAAEAPTPRRLAGLGAVIAVAAVARGTALLLLASVPLLALPPLPGRRGRWRGAAALWLGAVLVIAPVTLRNLLVGRDFVLLTSNGGLNLFIGQQPAYRGLFGPTDPEGGLTVSALIDPTGEHQLEKQAGRELRPSEVSRRLALRALDLVRRDPAGALGRTVLKGYRFWNGYEQPQLAAWDFWRGRAPVLRLLPVPFLLLAACGLPGLALLRPPARRVVTVFVLTWWASLLPFFTTDRYRFPVTPLLALSAAACLVALAREARAGRGQAAARRRAVILGLVVAGLAAALWPRWVALPAGQVAWQSLAHEARARFTLGDRDGAARTMAEADRALPRFAGTWFQLGVLAANGGDQTAALADFRHAEALDPGDRLNPYWAGRTLRRLGRFAEAETALEQAARLDSTWAKPHFELALTRLDRGDTTGALRDLGRAVALDPGAPQYQNNLASLLAQTGRADAARARLTDLIARYPSYGRARINLAVLLARTGDTAAARAVVAAARRIPTLEPAEREALARLAAELGITAGGAPPR
ncbi:MAG: tetratricopeptide repeat protein [Candidatus Krumholzibacteriia bacterium]